MVRFDFYTCYAPFGGTKSDVNIALVYFACELMWDRRGPVSMATT